MLESRTHRLIPLRPKLLSRCFCLDIVIVDGGVPPDGSSKLAIPTAA